MKFKKSFAEQISEELALRYPGAEEYRKKLKREKELKKLLDNLKKL